MRGTALAVVVVALTFPAAASAHASLSFVSPATQSRLDKPPVAVVMRFDQTVTITPRAIEVFTAGGHKVSGSAVSTNGTCNASEARITNAAMPTLSTPMPPAVAIP